MQALLEAPLAGQADAPAPYLLPRIPYLRLRFSLRSLADAHLPAYQGSLLRGAFGHALRTAVCAMGPAQPCNSCRLRRACIYTRLFETFIEDEPPPFLRGLPTSPRPYVVEPLSTERHLPSGAALEFDLLLIGQTVGLHAYAALAVERMAATGLGQARHRFALDRVRCQAPDGEWHDLRPSQAPPASATASQPPPAAPPRAVLRFLTPTRIKIRDHLASSIAPRALVFNILRRTLELAHFHVPGAEIDWTFRPLLDHASSIRVLSSDFRWHDWQRYSNRQQTKMSMGGFIGTLEIEGDLGPLWPLLAAAEILHVGKGATFGLGKFALLPGP